MCEVRDQVPGPELSSHAPGAILIGGRHRETVLGAGSLDPRQGVASGWLGKAAADGGAGAMALGIATHFAIATCMAAAYALVAARRPVLYRRPVACSLAYGLVLYAVMYRVVLPLRFPAAFPRWDGVQSATDIASHLGVALAIALVLSRRAVRR